MMTTNAQITRRRRVQNGGGGEPSQVASTDSVNTVSSQHNQQHQQHQHPHHRRSVNISMQVNGIENWISESSRDIDPGEPVSQLGSQNSTRYNRNGFLNNSYWGNSSSESAFETIAAAMLQQRGLVENFLEEFSHLFEDDDVTDDDLWGFGIQDWVSASGFPEDWSSGVLSSTDSGPTSLGLSKRLIKLLKRDVFVPKESRKEIESETGIAAVDSSEQEECSVCLDQFLSGQQLMCLPCKHRFHPQCLTPWLESHVQCPYCRAKISFEGSEAGASHDLFAWMEAVD